MHGMRSFATILISSSISVIAFTEVSSRRTIKADSTGTTCRSAECYRTFITKAGRLNRCSSKADSGRCSIDMHGMRSFATIGISSSISVIARCKIACRSTIKCNTTSTTCRSAERYRTFITKAARLNRCRCKADRIGLCNRYINGIAAAILSLTTYVCVPGL